MNANFESHSISRRSFLKASGVVGAASILAACGGSSSSTAASTSGAASGAAAPAADAITDYVSFETANRELETWNFLYSQSASDLNVTTYCWDGLLSFDCYGKAVPAIASSWEHNEDSTVWTFHLRDNVDWCDVNGEVKSHLTSKDFLVGFEWVLNALKNEAFNTSMPSETVVGAAEYYDLTKDKGDAAADMTYEDMLAAGVGIEAPDDYTLVFTCKNPCPYFDTVAAYNSFYPASEDLINELGIDGFRACDYSTMWYNGPYLIEEYIQQNTKSFIPNPNYYAAADCTRFEHHTITMISDLSMGLQLYENGEVDNIDLTESNLTTITSDPNNEHNKFLCEKRPTKYSFQMHLNFYTMPGVCYNTKGEEYTTLVAKEMGLDKEAYDGKTMKRLRSNNGDIADLKKQAMEELSAIGVTFPVHCYHYIKSGDTTALDTATVLKQCFSESFGDDFVVLDIGTYVSSLYKEIRNVQMHSILQNGWGADFGDPVNFLGQEVLSDDNAFYAQTTSWIAAVEKDPKDYQKDLLADYQEFTDLVTEAKAIVTDTDARYAAFAKAEASMLNNALCIPCLYEVLWCLTHVNEYTKINAMYGPCNYKAVNWETRQGDGYTTEEYEAFSAAFDAATKA